AHVAGDFQLHGLSPAHAAKAGAGGAGVRLVEHTAAAAHLAVLLSAQCELTAPTADGIADRQVQVRPRIGPARRPASRPATELCAHVVAEHAGKEVGKSAAAKHLLKLVRRNA